MKTQENKNPYATVSVLTVKAVNKSKSGIKSVKTTSSTDLRVKRGK